MTALDPATILGPTGAIARRLNEYEHRLEQTRMSEAVARAIADRGHLLVEAGTGVGKSFAYLVPAIQAAVESGKPVVISTGTINLQEQLIQKDIPFLRSIWPDEFSAVIMKGRSNYISLRRLEGAVKRGLSGSSRADEVDQLGEIRFWSLRTTDGSLSDLEFKPFPTVWDAVESDHGNCLGKKCRTYNQCFYYKAARRAKRANLIVVNHALYLADLSVRAASGGKGMLPDHDVVVFDEAHRLEAVASDQLGVRVGRTGVARELSRLYNERSGKGLLAFHRLHEAIEMTRRAHQLTGAFFDQVSTLGARYGGSNGRIRTPPKLVNELGPELRRLSNEIYAQIDGWDDAEESKELESSAARVESLADVIGGWIKQDDAEAVYWVEPPPEGRTARGPVLSAAPIDVGPVLRAQLFDRVPTCILTSATLCVGSPPSFDYIKARLGLAGCRTLQLGSPFDYPRQVTLHVARGLPDPSERPDDYERAAIEAIPRYLEMTHGKAFVLFTSNKMLQTAARQLNPWFVAHNIRLFAQTDGMPRAKMLEAFKSDVDSVIFGAESFWEGVDVPGAALSNVIIARLPFRTPGHPLAEARHEAIRARGGVPFREVQLPEAILRFKQGFGRLVRSKSDRGIVVVLDPRIVTKTYGRMFLDSVPKCPRVVE
ncbi:MAG: DEAD/DEAH box helicase [Planctomycetota bacterium]|nr:DEAD/DEAH box helicase [Planctomycetota bacterium]